jgi:hypothetical protein
MANLRGGHGCVRISRLLFLDEAVALTDSTQRLIKLEDFSYQTEGLPCDERGEQCANANHRH